MDLLEEAKYHYWAERKFFDLLKQITEEQWSEKGPDFSKSLKEIYIHKYEVMFSWLTLIFVRSTTRINDNPLKIPEFEPLSKDQFITEALLLFDKLIKYLEKNKLESMVLELEWIKKPYKVSNEEVIYNILNHLAYHRGQTAFMFKKLGLEIPDSDFNPYMYEKHGLV